MIPRASSCSVSLADNMLILEEVSKKFGQSKIVVSFDELSVLTNNRSQFEEFACELICSNAKNLKEAVEITNQNILALLPSIALDKMIEIMSISNVCGVSGALINENVKEIPALKALCSQNGILVNSYASAINWSEFKLNFEGMVPVITQDYKTGEVLMLAYMNEEAYNHTLKTGKMTYFSRSRNELWVKGDTSGHYQYVKSLTADCDMDTILAKVSQIGAACHTGSRSCFFQEIVKIDYDDTNPLKVFEDVYSVIIDRKINPKEGSYTNYLFDKGIDKILKKLGEEATEIIIASKNPNPDEIKYEISDFLYHMMVLMAEKNVTWEEITKELASR
ncbi:MAG: bifunctional phosphoribosyl-AMP cyclohydrolase/phosphoribosyl-ATP diphosphatase HisIE [Clostridiales bacterium]|nr:bifunctional phosphoribosyl-AMP cyclohydrolase/phosphoribosyl-ATP diphosphatase HisIE [Clostridiales bacterium]